jgi:hypothetical protein
MRQTRGRGRVRRVFGFALFLLYALAATVAHASTLLISDTTLVTGNETAVFSFSVPGPGTVSVQLTNLDWPQALSSLSFMATTGNSVLSSGLDAGSGAQSYAFSVPGGGTYFADVMATAGGSLDLGAYSFCLTFKPAGGPVPLPSSGVLLLCGALALLGFAGWRRRTRGAAAAPMLLQAAP